jgi:hypothetical protein
VSFLVTDLEAPDDLLYVNGVLYWSQGNAGGVSIDSFGISGNTVRAFATGQALPLAMTTNGSSLYWGASVGSGVAIDTAALASTADATELGTLSGDFTVGGLAVDTASVYVAAGVGGLTGAVFSLPIAGGKLSTLWSGGQGPASDVAVASGQVYWTVDAAGGAGEVLAAPSTGGLVTTLAAGQDGPVHLVVNDSVVYFTSSAGAVLSVPAAGGAVSTLASGLDSPGALAVDDAVYVATSTAILRVPK